MVQLRSSLCLGTFCAQNVKGMLYISFYQASYEIFRKRKEGLSVEAMICYHCCTLWIFQRPCSL